MADVSNIEINDVLLKIKDSGARELIDELKASGVTVPEWVSKMSMNGGTLSCGLPQDGIETFTAYQLRCSALSAGASIATPRLAASVSIKLGDHYVPDIEIGNWTPIFYTTSSEEVPAENIDARAGFFYRIGKLVHLDAQIITRSNYACYKIEGLPFEPNHTRPSSVYPVGVYSQNVLNSPINQISGTASYAVENDAYLSSLTASHWYVYGYYCIA